MISNRHKVPYHVPTALKMKIKELKSDCNRKIKFDRKNLPVAIKMKKFLLHKHY